MMLVAEKLTFTEEEYKELIEKALKYDLLKKHMSQRGYLTDAEKLLLGIEEKEN